MALTSPAALTFVASAFLPGNAATGTIAPKTYGCKAVKHSGNNGKWDLTLDSGESLTDGTIIIMDGPGVPTDSNSGIVLGIGDTGPGQCNIGIFHNDDGLPDNVQPASLTFWRQPKLT